MSELVRHVNEADFESIVVEGSRSRPVVVDFWAPWCGPCNQLSPLLEEMARAHAGEVDVVKVNVDDNKRLSAQLRVQGIPAVKAFADGRLVNEFTGLQPQPVIEQFFAALAPSAADRLVAAATSTDDPEQRRTLLEQAVGEEVDHPVAAVALAALLPEEEARDVLARARPTPEVQQAIARLNLRAADGDLDGLRRRADAGDPEALVALGRALAAAGEHEQAITALLAAVAAPNVRDDARETLLDIFTALGADHPLVRVARPKLASALF